jgi:hypothetical protein
MITCVVVMKSIEAQVTLLEEENAFVCMTWVRRLWRSGSDDEHGNTRDLPNERASLVQVS